MGTTLPGTKHIKLLDPRERAILWSMESASGVTKVRAKWIVGVGSTKRKRLCLRTVSPVTGALNADLFLAGGKRAIDVYFTTKTTIEDLRHALALILDRYNITVEI